MTQERDNMPKIIHAVSTDPNSTTFHFGEWEEEIDCWDCPEKYTSYTLTSIHTEVKAQRDELLAALKEWIWIDENRSEPTDGTIRRYKAAIKRAEGGKE